MIGWLFVILFILILLVLIDFHLGRWLHHKTVQKNEYPLRYSDLTLFINGPEFFDDLFEEMRQAKNHIHTLFYIFRDDEISKKFLSLLINKAKEGIKIRLLLDWSGGRNVPKNFIQQIRDLGGSFSYCNRPKFPFIFYSLNMRNHRKITVIDGHIGYIGGFNVGKEYINQDPKFGLWRDYHLKVQGEGVADLQGQFLEDWQRATKEPFLKMESYFPSLSPGKSIHQFISTDGGHLEEIFLTMFRYAKKEIIIGSPYFIPSYQLFQELIVAAKSGIRVKVIVPRKADHPFVKAASKPFFEKLLQAGGEVYLFYKGFYHTKVLVIDDTICDIGTANFDKRSLFLNYEMNCYIFDQDYNRMVIKKIEEDLSYSEKLTIESLKKRPLLERGKEALAMLISDLL